MTAPDRSDSVLRALDDILPELEDIYKDLHAKTQRSPTARSKTLLGA